MTEASDHNFTARSTDNADPSLVLGVVQEQSGRYPCHGNKRTNPKQPHGERIVVTTPHDSESADGLAAACGRDVINSFRSEESRTHCR